MDHVGRVASAISLVQLNSLFKAAIAEFGFEHFAGGCLVDRGRPANMFLQNWPDAWAREYSANAYAARDPILPRALAAPEPFTLHELLAASPEDPVLRAALAYGWRRVLIVPVHGPGPKRGIVSVASMLPGGRAAYRTALQDLSIAAYRRGCLLLSAAIRYDPLPRRQREVLLLASCGLTDHEIGARLQISSHTAHSHVESAKRRLGARSRAQAIALATERQLL